ncbi:MAG TPA: phosphatase PAP2 family protein [Noviherbaspirillum sp.]|uniref:phosphatase PAP2 family protein n=1 Tax=Noviherbaspirillum sp. TaxID=1926288 RepID=UPI002D3FF839|nr:phosphatase PAP2 family protein [Noviherbaspirillum sp.]HYD94474.1 phosphatase PAP2 family protein [Noviherbaspirillum sp.]
MHYWESITAAGDANITLPAAALIALWLAAARMPRLALSWCLIFGGLLVLVGATKLAFIGWGLGIRALDFTGISGHASRATAVIPVLVYLLCQTWQAGRLRSAVAAAYAAGALVACSRVAIGAHSESEVMIGFALGGAASAGFIRLASAQTPLRISGWLAGLGVLMLCGLTQLDPAPTKAWLKNAALYLSDRSEPFQRGDRASPAR